MNSSIVDAVCPQLRKKMRSYSSQDSSAIIVTRSHNLPASGKQTPSQHLAIASIVALTERFIHQNIESCLLLPKGGVENPKWLWN
jgi:hypothetical protein